MMKHLLFLFSLIFMKSILMAQQNIYVLNVLDNSTIPFATLYFETSKIAFMSNENGLVKVNTAIPLKIKASNLTDTLYLNTNEYEIKEVVINNLSAKAMVKKAINEIAENYEQEEFLLEGKYLQVHKENGKHVRFIEALLDVKNNGYAPYIKLKQEESFNIKALRKSLNYERNGDQHGDHLVDLFAENPIQYLENGILNIKNIDSYTWSLSQTNTDYYLIHFKNNSWGSYKNLKGYLSINKSDFAIVNIEIQELPNLQTNIENKSNWEFINGWYEVSFVKNKDVYVIDKATKWYNHQVRNERNASIVDYLVEEVFNWQTLKVSKEIKEQRYAKNSNLYSLNMDYNAEKWTSFPIDNAIRLDLEHKLKLEEQFLK